MEEIYKEHFIRSGAAPVPGTSEWKPSIQVYWTEGGKGCVKAWMASRFNQGFATERLAEVEGILFAREWIDEGKPNLEP